VNPPTPTGSLLEREQSHFVGKRKSMSDFKIQTTSPNALAGGQQALAADAEQKSRCGFTGTQVFPLSGKTGVNVESSSSITTAKTSPTPNNSPSDLNAGLQVTGRANEPARHCDERVIEGSGGAGSDFRVHGDWAKASLERAANGTGGPRGPVGQFPNGRRDAVLGSFSKDSANQNYPGNLADSDAGN
jgi:hypothetical protein